MPAERKAMSQADWGLIGDWIKSEKERRAAARKKKGLDAIWTEIDRQLAMEPKVREVKSGKKQDWLPDVELPLQFDTLEVNAADSRRLLFPRGSDWYSVSANLSDEYLERFNDRRAKFPAIGSTPDGEPIPFKIDQEAANTLVKATIDHFHTLYDFRGNFDLFLMEALKYGTAVGRVRPVRIANFFHEFRGTRAESRLGPAFIPVSVKNVFLDDTPMAVMNEGITMSPGHIRCSYKRLEDIKRSIKVGGPERGWRQQALSRLEEERGQDERQGHIEILEFEGDLVVPKSKGSIFLPHVLVTIASGKNPPEVIRFQENKYPFPSYVIGHYMREDQDSPYGISPLMKGEPLQDAATHAVNDYLAAAALSALPPVFYDRNDVELTARGGPDIFPGAQSPTDSPDAIEVMERAELAPMLQGIAALLKFYEDMTSVNDPRRGGAIKSHTTTGGVEMEAARGLTRIDDFIQGIESRPLTACLHMEYAIIKDVLKSPTPIQIDAGGIEGWADLASGDLADVVAIKVHGSAGPLNERQMAENFAAATNIVLQMVGIAAQLGSPISLDFQRLAEEVYRRAGINNASKFITTAQSVSGGAAPGQPVQGAVAGVPSSSLTDVARLFQ